VTNAPIICQNSHVPAINDADGPHKNAMNINVGMPIREYQNKFHGRARKIKMGQSMHQQQG